MAKLGYINTSYKLKQQQKKRNNAIGKQQGYGHIIHKRGTSNTYQALPNLTIKRVQIKTLTQFHNHHIGKILKSRKFKCWQKYNKWEFFIYGRHSIEF